MVCPNCRNTIADGLKFCSECGAPLTPQSIPNHNHQPQQYNPETNGYGITGEQYASTSLRFGIIGTCMDLTIFLSVVGLILGIVGIKKSSNASRMGVKSGKQKAGLILSIISLVLSVAIPFIFFVSCTSSLKNKSSSSIVTQDNNKELATKLQGTYTGSNGSVLILRDNMTSNYYYPGFGISTNTWTLKDNKIEMFISNCFCTVYANVDPNKTDSIYLESDSSLWDAETFTKISSDSKELTKEECAALVGANETPATTTATKTTEVAATVPATTTAANTSSGTSTTIDDMTVKEALDTYEAYVDKYVEISTGMMDGSLDYFEALSQLADLQSDMDELEQALNKLSESDMTAEEYKYYIEVMNRVSQKLLSAYS